jgi:M6 family metalloprotease-like protein
MPDATPEQITAFDKALERAYHQARGYNPDLTLTGIYNVLEKLRSGEVLTAKDKEIHDNGLVTILKQIHDDLDAAVLEAYGWSALKRGTGGPPVSSPTEHGQAARAPLADILARGGPDAEALEQQLLTRLVALNHERAAEEKRGLIRWLRPDYQAPGASSDGHRPPLQAEIEGVATSEHSKSNIPRLARRTARASGGHSQTPLPRKMIQQMIGRKYCATLACLAAGLLASRAAPECKTAVEPIPPLHAKGDVYKGEGEPDPLIYGSAVGHKKVILLYLDFPDMEMSIDTKERGRAVLGDGKFEELFGQQSYGKLSFGIEHVHGWRRLSKQVDQYSSATTESHRDLFVEIFKTYPEIDFRGYDYIVANMPRIGNTAFGERDDLAIPYRGGKIKVALNLTNHNPIVLAHETAHLMGLPDLYTYGGVAGPKNPAGPWDIMSEAGRSTGFLGWHRHKLKWLDADRKAYLTKNAQALELTPLSASSGVSMIVVPVGDPARPGKVFVIEVAQSIRPGEEAAANAGGVLIYSVDATLATGQNPVVVYPRAGLDEAAFHAGDSFDHAAAPFKLQVLKRLDGGSYSLDIKLKD